MKVEIEKDGALRIIAETVVEGWALNGIWPTGADVCEKCNRVPHQVIFDCSILQDRWDQIMGRELK